MGAFFFNGASLLVEMGGWMLAVRGLAAAQTPPQDTKYTCETMFQLPECFDER